MTDKSAVFQLPRGLRGQDALWTGCYARRLVERTHADGRAVRGTDSAGDTADRRVGLIFPAIGGVRVAIMRERHMYDEGKHHPGCHSKPDSQQSRPLANHSFLAVTGANLDPSDRVLQRGADEFCGDDG